MGVLQMHDLFMKLAIAEFNNKIYADADIRMLISTGVLNTDDYKEITGEDYVAQTE